MTGTLAIGYDVERIPGRVPGEKWVGQSVPENATDLFLGKVLEVHRRAGVPATIFMVGCNIEKYLPQLEACLASGLFEIAQHTHEHYPLKTVVEESAENIYLPGLPFDRIEEQIAKPVELLQKHLGVQCRGITAPYGYYRGLSDRPDILAILDRYELAYVRSYARNSKDYFPLDWDVQPFWYERQGFPNLLEVPMQGWIDAQWRQQHGWENWAEYHDYLRAQVDDRMADGRCWSHVQHDWTSILYDENLSWTGRFLQYAADKVEVLTHFQLYQRQRRLRDHVEGQPINQGEQANARGG